MTVDQAVREYHKRTEDHDRKVCSGWDDTGRVAMPVTPAQEAAVNKFANELKQALVKLYGVKPTAEAMRLYVSGGQLEKDERSNWDRPPYTPMNW
jgi:hypothetical protein